MSLQSYYNEFSRGSWAVTSSKECACRGHGWACSDVDTWHQCPLHYQGQLHPEYYTGDFEADQAVEAASMVAWDKAHDMSHKPLKTVATSVVSTGEDSDIPF